MKKLDLIQEFDKYFYENEYFSMRAERFYSELPEDANAELLVKWLRAAFVAGAKSVSHDSVERFHHLGYSNQDSTYHQIAEDLYWYYDSVFEDADFRI